MEKYKPSHECPELAHDLYTTKSDRGDRNRTLEFSVILIIVDEVYSMQGE